MLILECNHLKKYFADRLIFHIDSLKVYLGDRIGIVGLNGAGKTTLMNVLSRKEEPEEGTVKLYGECAYIGQLDEPEGTLKNQAAKEFGISGPAAGYMSGGEKTRFKIAQSLGSDCPLLFADEPTCNLDMKGIRLLEEKLKEFKGALFIVSHDRALLDHLCNKILEIENGKVTVFPGNYSDYRRQKQEWFQRQQFEFEQYVKEKEKLERAILEAKQHVKEMKKTPSRMGNSEARLHTRGVNGKKGRIDRAARAMESRIQQLEKKEKPMEGVKTRIDIQDGSALVSRVAISGRNIGKSFGSRVLFSGVDFEIPNGSKVALIGDNGTGKTTFIQMALRAEEGIRHANGVKLGYFSQSLATLDENRTILENVMKDSVYPEYFVRTVLARLLFMREDVFKKVGVLSGGERVKVSFAKIFVGDVNVIILDEPTNYLDIYSQEALESVLKEYEGTVLFASHDRRFINNIADRVMVFEDQKVVSFKGNYDQYMESRKKAAGDGTEELKKRKLLLETRLALVSGKLAMPSRKDDVEALDVEFKQIVEELKDIRSRYSY